MNCTQSQKMLDDFIDGSLSAIQFSSLHSHLNKCDDCRAAFNQAQKLVLALKDIPVPPAKAGYEKRVLSFLEREQTFVSSRYNWFLAGFGSAIAATLTIWLSITTLNVPNTANDNINSVKLVAFQTRKVDLIFNLPDEISNATLTIDLPEQVEIAGYPGKRQLQWNTSFKKGSNRLALPLVASGTKSGVLLAQLTKDGKTKTFRVHIDTKSAPLSSADLTTLSTNT